MSDIKYAIIGAGASGCYTAWRLAQADPSEAHRIAIVDPFRINGKPHIGGRLWSATLPGLSQIRPQELGGMRFLDSQKTVSSLVDHLGLDVVSFPVDSAHTRYMLRSTLLRTEDFADPDKVPYRLNAVERGMSPGALLSYGTESIVPNAPYLDNEEWNEVHANYRMNGELLRQQGAWNLLQTVLSEEGYNLAQAGSGYDTFTTNWNAADAMQWMMADFSPATQYLYVKDGFETVPRTLFDQATALGVQFFPWRLKRWRFTGAGVGLTLDDGTTAKQASVKAENLVLAMPRRSIELIDRPYDANFELMLPAVTPEHMFKFFIGYRYPWWRTLGMTEGRTVTDGPLRQIYYWGSNYGEFRSGDPAAPAASGTRRLLANQPAVGADEPGNSALMIYCDGRNTGFWKPLFDAVRDVHRRELVRKKLRLDRWGKHGENPNFRVIDMTQAEPDAATRALLRVINHQLRAAHGVSYVPEPYMLAYADWTVEPLGGAYNLWQPGYNSHEITNAIRTPYGADRPVHVVGEAYSLRQGWVEGALQTAEQLCQENFGLARPAWLPRNYLG